MIEKITPTISSSAAIAIAYREEIRLCQKNLTTLEARHDQSGGDVQARQSLAQDTRLHEEINKNALPKFETMSPALLNS